MPETAFISHPTCSLHEMGTHHPESSERLSAIQDGLIELRIADRLLYQEAVAIDLDLLATVHSRQHINWLLHHQAATQNDYFSIDGDTAMNAHSLSAARFAAGAGIVAIDGLYNQTIDNAFCAVRPPGHHAEKNRAMGFCFFNNIAIAANYAKYQYTVKRIAIVDFDVHHGNGTEDIVSGNNNILYCSSYQYPLFPYPDARLAKDNCLHAPMPSGTSSQAFRDCYTHRILPAVDRFRPELILISAGFDGHRDDPLADWLLVEADYAWVTKAIVQLAEQHCQGRIVSFLEGGYDLPALGRSAAIHIKCLAHL